MKTILVTKYGTMFRRKSTTVGEQGETEAMMHRLVGRNDVNVVYFGHWEGDEIPDVTVVRPHTDNIDDLATADAQRKGFDADVESLKRYDVVAFLMMCGYAPTSCMIDNETGSSVQSCAVRNCAPALNIINASGVPRLCVNSDPRTYPRDAEIVDLPNTRPAALLDQWNRELWMKIRGVALRRKSVYASVETWPDIPGITPREGKNASVVLSHCHVRDGMKSGSVLEDAWEEILRGADALVYGRGWFLTNLPRTLGVDRFVGEISPSEAEFVVAGATSGPILNHTPRFYTLKLKTYVSQGCVPLLWSEGPHAYDPVHRYVPRESYLRFHSAQELRDKTRELHENPRLVAQSLEFLRDATKPNWAVFDSLIDDVLAGRKRDESWVVDYGGYEKSASFGTNERRLLKDREGG